MFALSLILLAVPIVAPAQGNNDPIVWSVTLQKTNTGATLSMELSRPVPFLAYGLEKPHRLVVDLPEVRWRNGPIDNEPLLPFVRDSRFGLFAAGKSRLVLELDRQFTIAGQSSNNRRADGRFAIAIQLRPNRAVRNAPSNDELERRSAARAFTLIPGRKPRLVDEPDPMRIIVLDPGHGGIDSGAVAGDGTLEKNIVLTFGHELRSVLEENPNFTVVMTRDDDTFVRLRQRLQIAKQANADLFLSLHADSIRSPDFRGASVYTVSDNASDKEAERLAAQENKSEILADTDLSPYPDIVVDFLIDLVRQDTNNKSITFAEILVEELGKVTRLVKRNRRFAGFVVLKSPETPSVLLELGYLSNADDARELQNAERRAIMAQAIKIAVNRYLSDNP